jgi:hypothetical protein
LGPIPRGAVAFRLSRNSFFGNEAHASHAWRARQGGYDLTGNAELPAFELMHIHSNVNVRDQKTSAVRFQFVAQSEAIKAAECKCTFAQYRVVFLPLCSDNLYLCIRLYFENELLDHLGLKPFCGYIRRSGSDHTVQVRNLHYVRIEQPESPKTHVRKLLCNVRSATA